MNDRIAKVNKHIQRTFGEILLEEADLPTGVLITIAKVDTTPNLRKCTVSLYVSPLERGSEILAILKEQMYHLQGTLNRALHLKPLPRIFLRLEEPPHVQTFQETMADPQE